MIDDTLAFNTGLQEKSHKIHLTNDFYQLAATSRLRFRCSSAPLSFSSFVYNDEVDRCAVLSTIEVPSRKRARKRTLAFVKSPSLRETTMNCDPLNRVRNNWPVCCICERSNTASISSRIYIGAGLNWSRAIMREGAIKDLDHFEVSCRINRCKSNAYLCPPLSSVKLCFHTVPSWTFTSNPSMRSWPSGGWSFAKLPGKSSAKIPPKSLNLAKLVIRGLNERRYTCTLTFSQVFWSASRLYRSNSSIVSSIFCLSFSTVDMFFFRSASFFSTLCMNVINWQRSCTR